MALSRVKTWTAEILTHTDLNAEFDNILNNATTLISPLTADLAAGGYRVTGLALGTVSSPSLQFTGDTNTGVYSPGADQLALSVAGTAQLNVYSTATAGADLQAVKLAPTIVEASSGTHAILSSLHLAVPTITGAAGTVTNAATLYIAGATGATVSGTDYAMWVDSGNVKFDGNATVVGTLTAAIGTFTSTLSIAGLTWSYYVGQWGKPKGLVIGNTSAYVTDTTNDVSVGSGECQSNDATAADRIVMPVISTLIKKLDAAWAVGTDQGGLDTGSVGDGTYHIFVIHRTDTGVTDVLFSLSPTSPTMPTNYTKKRRIGSFVRASGANVQFVAVGDRFILSVPFLDVSTNNPGTGAITQALDYAPTGIVINALLVLNVQVNTGSTVSECGVLVTNLEQADSTPDGGAGAGVDGYSTKEATNNYVYNHVEVRLNSSAQFRYRASASDNQVQIRFWLKGWIDERDS